MRRWQMLKRKTCSFSRRCAVCHAPHPSPAPLPRNTHAVPHPTHGLQALRWITQTCVAFDGLCCVASTILAAPERSDTCAAPVAEDAPSSEGGSAPMHTDAPWEPAAPEEQPASMDMSGGDSGCVQPGGSLLDLLLQCDITLPRSVLRHEGRQEAPRGCVSLKQEPFRRTASGRHAPWPLVLNAHPPPV